MGKYRQGRRRGRVNLRSRPKKRQKKEKKKKENQVTKKLKKQTNRGKSDIMLCHLKLSKKETNQSFKHIML